MAEPDKSRNQNTNRDGGGATVAIGLNSTTATDVLNFTDSIIYGSFANPSAAHAMWLRPYAAGIKPTAKEGVFIKPMSNWPIPPDHPNIDQWSAIADTDSPSISVTTW